MGISIIYSLLSFFISFIPFFISFYPFLLQLFSAIYSATIAEITDNGRAIRVQYDDSDTEWVRNFSRVRPVDTTLLLSQAHIGDLVGKKERSEEKINGSCFP
jgi:hypothetical protein